MSRVMALDYGVARCGVALSDPSGTLATPLPVVERPATKKGLTRLVEVIETSEAARLVIGLPLTLAGEEGAQAAETREFAERLAGRISIPIDFYDERLTTRQAAQTGGSADEDSRAAAHLLEAFLQSHPTTA
jgi:putative Holliday junction resolvase